MNWPALAASIGGPVVGVAGVAFGWLNSRGDRVHQERLAVTGQTHARQMARDARLYEDLRDTYVDVLKYLTTMNDAIHRTEPIIGPQPPPPPMPGEDEARALYARVAALGADAVLNGLEAAAEIGRAFFAQAEAIRIVREQLGHAEGVQELQETRERYFTKTREIERLIREELRT